MKSKTTQYARILIDVAALRIKTHAGKISSPSKNIPMNLLFGTRLWSINKWIHVILVLITCSMPLHAALGPKVQLRSKLSLENQQISVTVPKGYSNVSVELLQKGSGWQSIVTADAITGVITFNLPSYSKNDRWRVMGRKWFADQPLLSRNKFPAKFYKGKNIFGAIDAALAPFQFMVRSK